MESKDAKGEAVDEQTMSKVEVPDCVVDLKCVVPPMTIGIKGDSVPTVMEALPVTNNLAIDTQKWSAVLVASKDAKCITKEKQVLQCQCEFNCHYGKYRLF